MTFEGPTLRRASDLQLRSLTKTYREVLAVDDLDLEIEPGEFVTLLGPSGSGKTTTLMMIAGFQIATSGSVSVDGRDLTYVPPNQRDIGVVFQNYALFPHLTVFQNVAFSLQMRKFSKAQIREKVYDALDLVKLGELAKRYPNQLSGGQQQRVALARAVVFEPGLALMDEPLGALDRQLREQMQYEIKRFQESLGITVVYVTHDQQEALVMSDRVAVMHHGRLEQVATPAELYQNPASAFVATFVGESNVLHGTVLSASSDGVEVKTRGGMSVTGTPVGAFTVGQSVVCTIRPESVQLMDDPTVFGGDVAISPAVVVRCEEAIYSGDTSRFSLVSPGGDRLILRSQNRPGSRQLFPTEELKVSWRLSDLRVFSEDSIKDPIEGTNEVSAFAPVSPGSGNDGPVEDE